MDVSMQRAMRGRLPDFLFIGAMKSATTTMADQLRRQPGIFMVDKPKELYFFSRDENFEKGVEWYRERFAAAAADDLCGEAATTYTQLPTYQHVVSRMRSTIPDAKLIYIMRHPVDRLVSQFHHDYTLSGKVADLNRAIQEDKRLMQYSLYAYQLAPFLEAYGKDRVLPMFFENIVRHPQSELERLCGYLGYPRKPTWDFTAEPRNVTRARPSNAAWLKYVRRSRIFSPLREVVPKKLRKGVRRMMVNEKRDVAISPANMSYLQDVFNRDLETLGSWLGVSLSCANYLQIVSDSRLDWDERS